jgi:general secretion pathway protein H
MTSRNSHAGFTLLEMLVVVAVMGLALLLLTAYGQPHSHRLQTEAAARQVAEAMRSARGLAITRGQPVTLAMPQLPAWLHVAIAAPKGGIVFSPDGSASGGTVLLDGDPQGFDSGSADGKPITVSVDWLTGRVQVDAP